jgi:hypothetical protein
MGVDLEVVVVMEEGRDWEPRALGCIKLSVAFVSIWLLFVRKSEVEMLK